MHFGYLEIIILTEYYVSGWMNRSIKDMTDFAWKIIISLNKWKHHPFMILPAIIIFPGTGDSRYVDFAYLATITYVEVIFHSQHFFSIYLCSSTPSMSKTVNMKQRVSRGDFSCTRCIFYYICYFLCWSQKSVLTRGVVLSVSAMYMYYLRCENLPNENKKKIKWYTFFRLSN